MIRRKQKITNQQIPLKRQFQNFKFSIFRRSHQLSAIGNMRLGAALSQFSGNSARSISFNADFNNSRYFHDENYNSFQYVNPKLVLEWEGKTQTTQISGEGTFKAYEQSYEGIFREKKLIFSLEADNWKSNRPEGKIKMHHFLFYTPTKSDSVVREVRRFVGNFMNMKRQGYGEYLIEYHYSNENKEVVEIKGTWANDFIVNAKMSKDGGEEKPLIFHRNIENSIPKKATVSIAQPTLRPISKKNHQNPNEQGILRNKNNQQEEEQKKIKESPSQVLKNHHQQEEKENMKKDSDNFLSIPLPNKKANKSGLKK